MKTVTILIAVLAFLSTRKTSGNAEKKRRFPQYAFRTQEAITMRWISLVPS